MAFPMGGEGEASGEILGFQFRKVFDDLFLGHATGKVFEYIFHRDTHSPDTGLAAALVRGNRDSFMKVHGENIEGFWGFCEDSFVVRMTRRLKAALHWRRTKVRVRF